MARIAIVASNEGDRVLFTEYLQCRGHEVITYIRAAQFFQAAREAKGEGHPFEALIVGYDGGVAEQDSISSLALVRGVHTQYPKLPIIVAGSSDHDDDSERMAALSVGACAYIASVPDIDALIPR